MLSLPVPAPPFSEKISHLPSGETDCGASAEH